ncbi:MAG: hypothetical protein JW866_09515 [Ignavibacteriales bacterium]|nr:hypothetical protein [Ignavibacteriales bacterium]
MKIQNHLVTFSIILTIVIFFNCQETRDMNSELKTIMDTDKAFSDYAQKYGITDAFSEFADSNAIKLPSKGHPVKWKNVPKNNKPMNKNVSMVWEPLMGEISQSCDLGYTLGKWVFTQKDSTGYEQKSYGYYVSIWKKQNDDTWKWIIDLGNESDEPTTEDFKFLE